MAVNAGAQIRGSSLVCILQVLIQVLCIVLAVGYRRTASVQKHVGEILSWSNSHCVSQVVMPG